MSDWISVEDRLPDFESDVLGCQKHSNENHDYCVVYLDSFTQCKDKRYPEFRCSEDLSEYIVTHWMPLPDPPETQDPELFEGTREQLNNLGVRK